jgi:CheY-like chemotaxis protein/HPt (histidine-containing phosphotransfer) domain-containing protein
LVAEDNPVNQLVMEELLRGEGADVVLAGNGRQVLKLIANSVTPFDAVLMDVQMPEMDGLEATRQLKLAYPELKVIGQTAHALKEELDKCQAAGMVATVNKPIDLEILVSTLRQHLPNPKKSANSQTENPQPSTSRTETPAIDWQGLAKNYPNKPDFIQRLLSLFIQQHAETHQQLRNMAAAGDLSGIQKLAHDLKSTAGNLYAVEVQTLAIKTMEHAGQNSLTALDDAQQLADAMEKAINALSQGLPKEFKD